ncbi:TlpA family protein disulfide reductase [Flaviaesturariibacter aridisoli]|uniref:TlpA family protein disulfide reductase n=1 Tax=Flaviaesturariibacter aridisoli TaxID=2545761 RepID=A0A4R4DZ49_9BACT|nr:TlpA disulfide reductase family protein [Flaviaesturariibacter aridisoli]TCZ71409.1 TlpA family protein disulfide reductase [Flaviaesturariibacter aridisoli]
MRFVSLVLIFIFPQNLFAQRPIAELPVPAAYARSNQQDEQRYQAWVHPVESAAGTASNNARAAKAAGWKNFNLDSAERQAEALQLAALDRRVSFMKQNPGSYTSLRHFWTFVLNATRMPLDSVQALYRSFSAGLRATPLGRVLEQKLVYKEALRVGQPAPDCVFTTVDGQRLQLSSFRNRNYVLLCLWASWCRPCQRSIPKIRQLDSVYRAKGLQVIHISVDTDTAAWKQALAYHQMPWPQTCDLPAYTGPVRLADRYDACWVPRYYLVDKAGTIRYDSVRAHDDEGWEVLRDLLQKELN